MLLSVASATHADCKICGSETTPFGVVDFNKHASEDRVGRFPTSGVPIAYRRCSACGFIFCDAFDKWSPQEFETHIYNADYVTVDPDYVESRPRALAERIIRQFGSHRAEITCLDYGGGNGLFADLLRRAEFKRALTYDAHSAVYNQPEAGPFNLVTCFEVFEHVTDPKAVAATLAELIGDRGILYFSTLLQPKEIEELGVAWWYLAPRNGHISMYTRRTLDLLFAPHGLHWGSFNSDVHLAWRTVPPFAASLFRPKHAM